VIIMKTNQTASYSLRVNRILLKKFRYIADYEGRSTNREIEQIMRQHVKKHEDEHGAITSEMLDAFYAKES